MALARLLVFILLVELCSAVFIAVGDTRKQCSAVNAEQNSHCDTGQLIQ